MYVTIASFERHDDFMIVKLFPLAMQINKCGLYTAMIYMYYSNRYIELM